MYKVLSYILCDLDPKVKVIGKKSGYLRWCTIDCCSSLYLLLLILFVRCVIVSFPDHTYFFNYYYIVARPLVKSA